ncbi:hypothetical protein ACFVFH_35440 [Streptomyces sp. NPDC057697]|uniref:hypothetical protein n=1 Tax=Streptomyces sp. NPDC057697 TaxID=3346219 RepID=UPI003695B41C
MAGGAGHTASLGATRDTRRYEEREAVRAGHRAVRGTGPVQVREIRRISAYETTDPQVITAEHVVVGALLA